MAILRSNVYKGFVLPLREVYTEILNLLDEIDEADGSYSSGARDAYSQCLVLILKEIHRC